MTAEPYLRWPERHAIADLYRAGVTYPELRTYCQLAWSEDLRPWGLIVSIWYDPATKGFAYLYKHADGYCVAKTYDEQIAVHERFGVPVVGPGEEFKDRGKQSQPSLFAEASA